MNEDQIVEAAEKEMDALRAETEQVRAAQRKADAERETEKRRRVYYQDIVYSVCNMIEGGTGKKIVCGTIEEPSTGVQDGLEHVIDNLHRRLREERETIQALEAIAVKHGYDMETGECLTDWLDKRIEKVTCPEIVGGGARDCRFLSASRGVNLKLFKRLISIRRQFNLVDKRTDFTILELAILEIFKKAQEEDEAARPVVHDAVPKRSAGVDWLFAELELAEERHAEAKRRLEEFQQRAQEQIDHWKKKYNEKVFAND